MKKLLDGFLVAVLSGGEMAMEDYDSYVRALNSGSYLAVEAMTE